MANEQPAGGRPADDDMYFPRTQNFDVVLLKKGTSPIQAKPEDFTRVHVRADSVSDAEKDAAVEAKKKEGFVVHKSVPPGYSTEAEVEARRREHDERFGIGDRSKW